MNQYELAQIEAETARQESINARLRELNNAMADLRFGYERFGYERLKTIVNALEAKIQEGGAK